MTRSRLRIGVDGRAFGWPAAGIRRYVAQLYRAMLQVAPELEIVAIGGDRDALPEGIDHRAAFALPTNLGWMAASIPLAARGAALDVFHAPAYTAPLWGVHPLVLTIHDVSYERHPEWDAYKNDAARRWFYRKSASVADAILTVSEFSRSEISAVYGIDAARISVAPLAASEAFTPGPFDPKAAPAGVRRPYVLHVGDLQVRRNLTTALSAVLAARQAEPRCVALSLVCAGIDRGVGKALIDQARAAGQPDALVLTGRVDDRPLLNLYRGAAALVYPSRYEGFGLPLVEAMACGVPVIGARCGSIPEVTGGAGTLLDPLDVSAWTTAVTAMVTDAALVAQFRARSLARAAEFSWRRTAAQTLAVFREYAGLSRR